MNPVTGKLKISDYITCFFWTIYLHNKQVAIHSTKSFKTRRSARYNAEFWVKKLGLVVEEEIP
jgi:hypothetical protein